MAKRKAETKMEAPSKRMKLSEYHHDMDDLFKNKNIYTLPSSQLSGQLKVASTKLHKNVKRILIQFTSRDGNKTGTPIDIPIGFDPEKLLILINTLLQQSNDPLPYSFYYNHAVSIKNNDKKKEIDDTSKSDNSDKLITNTEIVTSLRKFIETHNALYIDKNKDLLISTENILSIIYEPQSLFRVEAVGRCTANLSGHSEAILNVSIRPDCLQIASGSGDTTIRLWSTLSQTPTHILKGHKHWVLSVEYSPNGKFLASADKTGQLFLWNTNTGYKISKYPLNAHSKYITSISWEPFHLNNGKCERLVTSSKDKLIKIWNTRTRKCMFTFSGHSDVVTNVKWGGEGYIYSSSRDRTIRVWNSNNFTCLTILRGHAHWVNHISLSTENILKFGPYKQNGELISDNIDEQIKYAKDEYIKCKGYRGELLVSASDDYTLFLWNPLDKEGGNKPVARMTGHVQLVNHVLFSPDGKLIASASFDKSIRIWDALTGKFILRLLGHVQSVYQICWSADSRMIASASKDSTIKLWNLNIASKKKNRLIIDLPGHADEVYTLDWSHNGQYLVSGSKDRILRIHQP